MKHTPWMAAATVTLLMTAASGSSQGAAQEEVLLPEVKVRGQPAPHPHHPQDPTYSTPPIGCVEAITPGAADSGFGYANAARAKEGIPVIPDLNVPSSGNGRNATLAGASKDYYQNAATPPGQEGKPGCAR